jgi:ketohexokinase
MARILGVGVATLDIINEVAGYPPEDSEVRALGQRIARGGNVTNSLVILSQLGHECAWAGTYADEPDSRRVLEDLSRYEVDVNCACCVSPGKVPTSCVTLSRTTGSRTIVHYRDLREFGFSDFAEIDLGSFDWIHFEGRNVADLGQMLALARRTAPAAALSLEIEKPRSGVETLFADADVLMFSHAYAAARGWADPVQFLDALGKEITGKSMVCGRGSAGAVALDTAGNHWQSAACVPNTVVDSLGAGDAFNAGVIDGLLRGKTLKEVLTSACRLAGKKCGQIGFDGLGRT